jgi:hypothetical protein
MIKTRNPNVNRIVFITYPRSGVNYFAEYFMQMAKFPFPRFHNYKWVEEGQETFTIVRNPIDTITSNVTMSIAPNPNYDLKNIADCDAQEYLDFYTNIVNKKIDNIISYDEFLKNPKTVMINFLNYTKIDYENIEYKNTLKNRGGYLVSSKNSELYESVLKYTSTLDLSKHQEQYQIALKKSKFV